MLALVSTPANALSETWDQKLDLTIPLLETQSTWPLDSKDKLEIMMGFECCYRNELLEAVKMEHSLKSIELQSKANPNQLQFTHAELIDPYRITTFAVLQIADVYYTYKGLQYDCVKELNPIIGERPSLETMILTKTAVLIPAYRYDYKRGNLSNRGFDSMNVLMSLVIVNNINVLKRAKKYCQLR